PPPTNNTLDPEERSRLLRSTRKLGAVLGITPFLLEPEGRTNSLPKATRREGRIYHSPSSSVSSMDTTEPDYVLVKSRSRSAPYQVQSIPSPFPTPTPSHENKPVGKKRKGADGAKNASQPLLLRLRSGPAHPADSFIKSSSNRGPPAKPLSPVASTFNMDIAAPVPATLLSDREKRRKMAKLTRTLGENVPPELVFLSASPPPLAVAEAPLPPPKTSTVEQPEKSSRRRDRPQSLTLGATSAVAAATAAMTRGTTSLDAPSHVPTESIEFGRRKEREWSGEWNMKDMDDVARRLRGLK
ncbi:hypothetical protein BDZ97DRAFT_1590640, partial [Flammula alnicola]